LFAFPAGKGSGIPSAKITYPMEMIQRNTVCLRQIELPGDRRFTSDESTE
jgi:hypothetical protein